MTIEFFHQEFREAVHLHRQEMILNTKFSARKRDSEGHPTGVFKANPILETRVYQVTYPDNSCE
jgi:hypothetical protein